MDTPNAATPSTTSDATSDSTPYRNVASHIVADTVALAQRVYALRPETKLLDGALTLTVWAASGTIMLSLDRGNGTAVAIEQIDANPQSPTFGASTLPIVTGDGPAH